MMLSEESVAGEGVIGNGRSSKCDRTPNLPQILDHVSVY